MTSHRCGRRTGADRGFDSVFATKLVPPGLGPVVNRNRLFQILDTGVRTRLTMVIGPPGAGKSALLASWARSRAQLPGTLAWLSLDEEDNEQERLCAHLTATLRRALAGCPGADPETSEIAWPDRSMSALVNTLGALRSPIVLVLDDFHELRPGPAQRAVLQLARHAPAALRLVLASRREPDLPVHKLRASGELAEVRGPDLAFRPAEIDELFRMAGVSLTPEQVAKVARCSGGWAMALQLAAIIRSEDGECQTCLEGWSKVTRLCSDFLLRELLEPMPAAYQDLLLRCSVVSRLNASLVRAITGRPDASRMLRCLASEHDLLIREDTWTYRQNPLIRHVLSWELMERHGAQVTASVHRAASQWYAAQGLVDKARQHATAADLPAPFPGAESTAGSPRAWGDASPQGAGEERDIQGSPGAAQPARSTGWVLPPHAGGHEPLTSSELQILRLLPAGLTIAQIASQRHVSINTVKTQVKGIYRKLSVCQRKDAVEAARRHGLL